MYALSVFLEAKKNPSARFNAVTPPSAKMFVVYIKSVVATKALKFVPSRNSRSVTVAFIAVPTSVKMYPVDPTVYAEVNIAMTLEVVSCENTD